MGAAAVPAAIVGGSAISGMISSNAQSSAASKAASAETQAAAMNIEEQRRQFDEIRQLLDPFVQAGSGSLQQLAQYTAFSSQALEQQAAMAGLGGERAEQQAISQVEQSPTFQALLRQGEESILQNASATGGLRGGNVQGALAQFRPQLLNQLLEQRYSRLGGITSLGVNTSQNLAQLGQASAAGVGTAGMQSAANIGNALTNAGSAQAAQAVAQGQAQAGLASNIAGAIPTALMFRGGFGGGGVPSAYSGSPFWSPTNPLGLTPGQGL